MCGLWRYAGRLRKKNSKGQREDVQRIRKKDMPNVSQCTAQTAEPSLPATIIEVTQYKGGETSRVKVDLNKAAELAAAEAGAKARLTETDKDGVLWCDPLLCIMDRKRLWSSPPSLLAPCCYLMPSLQSLLLVSSIPHLRRDSVRAFRCGGGRLHLRCHAVKQFSPLSLRILGSIPCDWQRACPTPFPGSQTSM